MTSLCFYVLHVLRIYNAFFIQTATLCVTMFFFPFLTFLHFLMHFFDFVSYPGAVTLTGALANLTLVIQKSRKINHLSTS